MSTLIHQRVEAARRGTNPTVIARLRSGWAVLGDVQVVRGYSLLLPDPVVVDLNGLPLPQRTLFLQDMSILGDALIRVTGAVRINYEILGNREPALHAHVFPRLATEPNLNRSVRSYDWDAAPRFDVARDQPLMNELTIAIQHYSEALKL